MKLTVSLLVVLTAAYVSGDCLKFVTKDKILSEEEKLKVAQICKDCIKETNVQEEMFEKILNDEYPDNRELKCFFRCSAIRSGAFKENGEFNLTRPERLLSKDRFEQVKKCVETVRSDDQCDLVYGIHKCYINKVQELNIV